MPYWLCIVILGIVEGITEFLPVSSTGHLLIAQKCGLPHQTDTFNVVIQAGAVLAVIPLFRDRFDQFIHRWREKPVRDYMLKIIVAFVITGAVGFVLEKKGVKLTERLTPIAWALLVGGVLFLAIEAWLKGKKLGEDVTWTVALAVAVGQLIAAVFPGASRSGTTIMFSLLLGLSRPAATEFSFLVGIPTMLAASGYKIFKALYHPPANAPHEDWSMIILASVVAAVVSFIAVKWLLRYVQSHTFNGFGWYRILAGAAVFVLVFTYPEMDTPADKEAPVKAEHVMAHPAPGATPEKAVVAGVQMAVAAR